MTGLALVTASFVSWAQEPSLRLTAGNTEDVLHALTVDEKLHLVTGSGWGSLLSGFGIPFTGHPRVPGAAGMTNAVPRLGIPQIVLSDGPAGVRIKPTRKGDERTYYCTRFPSGMTLASTWDVDVVRQTGAALGDEAAAYGIDIMLAPGMNIMRHPLCSRGYEYYSEDPLLSGRTAAAMISGIQSEGVGACAKHFAANNQETNRLANDARIDSATLRNIYLSGFEIAVREGKPWTVMSSYNRLNGERTQEDRWLLTDVLRRQWGFDGIVVTDWTGKRNTARQIAAGNDMMQPGDGMQRSELRGALRRGKLDEALLDTCVLRILNTIVRTRTFRGDTLGLGNPHFEKNAQVARRAAADGMVLLENRNGTLPLLPSQAGRVALFGCTSYELIAGGTGSGFVNSAYSVSMAEGLCNAGFVVDSRLSADYEKYNAKKSHRLGSGGFGPLQKYMGKGGIRERMLDSAYVQSFVDDNDVAMITIGRQAGEGKDRKVEDDFLLTDAERKLIRLVADAFHHASKRVVVVLNVTGVVETASWKSLPDAILMAWCPGQEGGNAIADVISGEVCPSGRLPLSFPINIDDFPASANFPQGTNRSKTDSRTVTRYGERDMVGYRYYNATNTACSYPFGYGLSYTDFSESEPSYLTDRTEATVVVTNTGRSAGRHVVMLTDDSPMRQLTGYAKTRLLQPGESDTLCIKVYDTPAPLSSSTCDDLELDMDAVDSVYLAERMQQERQLGMDGLTTFISAAVQLGTDRSFIRHGYGRGADPFGAFPKCGHSTSDYGVAAMPLAAAWIMKAAGVKSVSSTRRMLVANALSLAFAGGLTQGLKSAVSEPRPDMTNRNALPSGHTALAFCGATILAREYGYISPWISIGGYSAATLTQLLRVRHNAHWANDLTLGAAIGMVSANLAYFVADRILPGDNVRSVGCTRRRYNQLLSINERPSGFSVLGGNEAGSVYISPGSIEQLSDYTDYKLRTINAVSAGVEGSWFLNDCFALEGMLRTANALLKVYANDQSRVFAPGHLDIYHCDVAAKWQFPLEIPLLPLPPMAFSFRCISGVRGLGSTTFMMKGSDGTAMPHCRIPSEARFEAGCGISFYFISGPRYFTGFTFDYTHTFSHVLHDRFFMGSVWRIKI